MINYNCTLNGTRLAGSAFDLLHFDNVIVQELYSYCENNCTEDYSIDYETLLAGFSVDPTDGSDWAI
jgi:hypothetical protein